MIGDEEEGKGQRHALPLFWIDGRGVLLPEVVMFSRARS